MWIYINWFKRKKKNSSRNEKIEFLFDFIKYFHILYRNNDQGHCRGGDGVVFTYIYYYRRISIFYQRKVRLCRTTAQPLVLQTCLSNAYMYTFLTINTLPLQPLPPLNVLHFNQAHRNRAFVLFEIFYCYKLL